MINLSNKEAYVAKFDEHMRQSGREDAAKLHVGPTENYERVGFLTAKLLKEHVIDPNSYLVDVGCGSGRIAAYLADWPDLKYFGTDVVGKILDAARARTNRPDWRFEEVGDFIIPVEDNSVDAVCFFSVFTHLLHEESFLYLHEAARAIKPGGKIAFSYLTFDEPAHEEVFRRLVRSHKHRQVLTMFFDRPAIDFWARELKLEVVEALSYARPVVNVDPPASLKDGSTLSGEQQLNQAFCVLRKP
jgi:SAM-dependent methyltransferase